MQTLGDRIRGARKRCDLGLRETAGKIFISPAYLSRIEKDEIKPGENVLKLLSELLGEDFDDLMNLAGRIPGDILDILRPDKEMWNFLRKIHEGGWTGEKLKIVMGLDHDWIDDGDDPEPIF